MIADTTAELLRPLDDARAHLLRALRPVHPLLLHRDRRVPVLAVLGVGTSFTLTALAPTALLALGPLALGLAHLLADVRYLVVRDRGAWGPWAPLLVGAPLVAVAWTVTAWVGLLAAVGAVVCARAPWWRRAALLLALLPLVAVAHAHPVPALLLAAHGHNLVALIVWLCWRPSGARLLATVVALTAYAAVWLGALDGVGGASVGLLGELESTLGRGLDPVWARRAVLSFAFAQSLHYAVWLRWIPDDDRHRRTSPPLRAAWRALVVDVGATLPLLTLAGTVALLAWATIDLSAARTTYLHLAGFHGWLELAALAAWATRRQ